MGLNHSDHTTGVSSEETRGSRFTVRDFLYILFRHKWKVTLFFFFVAFAGVGIVWLMPNLYSSEAQVLVKLGRNPLTRDPEISVPEIAMSGNPGIELASIIEMMRNRGIAELVVDKVGADAFLQRPPAKFLVRKIRNKLKSIGIDLTPEDLTLLDPAVKKIVATDIFMKSVGFQMKGNILAVTYTSWNPQLAQKALGALLDVYLKRHIEVYAAQVSTQFFQSEADKAKKAFEDKARELKTFSEERQITSIDRQIQDSLGIVTGLESAIRDTGTQISASRAR